MIIQPATRSFDEIIDQLQTACSRTAESVGMMHARVQRADRTESSVGTAYCVDKRGFFVTALHVVAGQLDSFISMDRLYETRIVAVDLTNDLALMQVVSGHGLFQPVVFATSVGDDEIVGGLGYPERGMSIELCSYLARYAGPIVNGVGPNGLILEGDILKQALSFVGGEEHTQGYSGGPIVNERGEVVASTMKGDDDLGFIIGPSFTTVRALISAHV
ncbi:MAG: serine protease [Candidatus Melainabacteria bacterium]|jgi:S1-C subfamily serine protease|nr:MAG: serine protease [Candidatus Melainabacteria bacterium]